MHLRVRVPWCLGLLCTVAGLLGIQQSSLAAESGPTPGGASVFVATNGNDSWSGKLAQPNAQRTDGPFATLQRAVEYTRTAAIPADAPKSIFLNAGTHFLSAPLALSPVDNSLVLAAAPGQRVVISGGRLLSDWTETSVGTNTVFTTRLPEEYRDKWNFRTLWVNGKPTVRARYPNQGYLAIESLLDKSAEWTQGHSRFRFKEGDLKSCATMANGEVVAMTRWVESRLPIAAIDEKERIIRFGKRSVFELAPDDLYYVEGIMELLDAPGEWYLDPKEGRLFYWPRPGESIKGLEAIAPVLTQVMRIEGSADKPVENLRLHGLSFSHTEWYYPDGFATGKDKPELDPAPDPEVGGFGQAAIGVPGAVRGDGLCNSSFTQCSFENLSNYALELRRACHGNIISQCEFHSLGAGGLKIGETRIRDEPKEITRNNAIIDCHVYDGGRLFHSAIGIWIGQSPDNRIEHNHIHDFYYTGISVGWTWGYSAALATNTCVQFNHVHHIGVRSDGDGPILSDMAGIYTLGKQSGSVIRSNLWHDTAGLRYGGWGIYFDEGSSGILAEKNIVYRTTHGGFHQHYGETNVVRNNIFAFARDFQVQRSRVEPHVSFSFQTNIVYFDSGVLFAGTWAEDKYKLDYNVYFDTRTNGINLGTGTWEEWQTRGHDQHSIIADPLFESPENYNFRLRSNSPAIPLGFQPFDLRDAGVRKHQ